MAIYTDMSDAPAVLREFLSYIGTIRNLSKRTLEGYYIDLRTFFRFYKKHRGLVAADTPDEDIPFGDITFDDLAQINTLDVYEYLNYAMTERENNANSRARKLASLRTFFKYYTTKTYPRLESDPVKDIDVPSVKKSIPRFLSLDESRRLLESVPEGELYERDYCIITLFLNCGMRLSELVGMNISDVDSDTARIVGKGNKERQVFLNDACLDAVKNYLPLRRRFAVASEPNALFISRRGQRITPRRVEQIVESCLRAAQLSDRGYSPHKLRHTAATLMYRYGDADMLALKEILGHEHVSTTEIYTHISDDQLRKAATSSPLAAVRAARKPSESQSGGDADASDEDGGKQ